jgi:hypothetical protein
MLPSDRGYVVSAPYWETERYRRQAAALRYGSDMTVAIAAFVPGGHDHIVTVSDARLSYNEMIPASDSATMKSRRIAKKWGLMFAAEDATAFSPVVNEIQKELSKDDLSAPMSEGSDHSYGVVSTTVRVAYEREFSERFFRQHLAPLGYADIAEFRKIGFAEMGKDLYYQHSMALAKHDLGLELLGYGFSKYGDGFIFEIANPGKIISHFLRGYAAIGSGSLMALAALNRKPMTGNLSEVIYRLLDAKFSSETARDVGKKTYVITMSRQGKYGFMGQPHVEKVRDIWNKAQKKPEPAEALKIINKSRAVTEVILDLDSDSDPASVS